MKHLTYIASAAAVRRKPVDRTRTCGQRHAIELWPAFDSSIEQTAE